MKNRTFSIPLLALLLALFHDAAVWANDSAEPGPEFLAALEGEACIAHYAPVLEANPEHEAALFYTARALMLNERFIEARTLLERLVEVRGDDTEYWMWNGRATGLSLRQESMFKARKMAARVPEALGRAIMLDEDNVEARLGLLQFYAEAPFFVGGSIKKAREENAALAEIDALYGRAGEGIILIAEKRYDEGRDQLETVIADGLHHGMVYAVLGEALRALKQNDEARVMFERSLETEDGRVRSAKALKKLK